MSNIKTHQLLKNELVDAGLEVETDFPLAKVTTWKIGGPADLYVHSKKSADLEIAIRISKKYNIPFTVLGWGSNVLISDKGIRGLVIKNSSNNITILGKRKEAVKIERKVGARLQAVDKDKYYDFKDLDYDETEYPQVRVSVESGIYLPLLINVLIDRGVTGLQWFAGIPGTIGGAIYNNIHGGSRFFSEVVYSAKVLKNSGEVSVLRNNDLKFDYDYSIFHDSQDVILSADLILREGDKERARQTSIAWATRKRLQPANSAGCCFQNIPAEVQKNLGLQSNSWGYIIDQILGLKGYSVGMAKISDRHAAFIETKEGAKSSDILAIFEKIYDQSRSKLGITPKTEIFFLGFNKSETSKYSEGEY